MFVQMAVLDDDCSRYRRHLQLSFSSQEEKETYLRRFEAAKLLLAPGVNKLKATISVLNALLDRVLAQTESVPVSRSRTSSSANEMMLDSAG